MPGFGFGSFGSSSFGAYPWAFQVFYELLPELHRTEDANNGYALRKFCYAVAEVWTDLKTKVENFSDLRDALLARTSRTTTGELVLGKVKTPRGVIEQKGIDGEVIYGGTFSAPSARFTDDDAGKILRVWTKTQPGMRREFMVSNVVDSATAITDPTINPGSGYRWELERPGEVSPDSLTIEVKEGLVTEVYPGWTLNDNEAEFTVDKRSFFPGVWDTGTPVLFQQESTGATLSAGVLSDSRGKFSYGDKGKIVLIREASDGAVPGVYAIADIPSDTTIILDPTPPDATNVSWAISHRSEIRIKGTTPPRGVVLREGECVLIANTGTTGTILLDASEFSSEDVGRKISLVGVGVPFNGTYTISSVPAPNTIILSGNSFTPTATPMLWELRDPTDHGADGASVQYRSPSELAYLANDFGLYLDELETEARQRRWVEHSNAWVDLKGTQAGYHAIGDCSGVDVEVAHLYRISPMITLPSDLIEDIEKSGTGASLVNDGLLQQVTAPFNSFSSVDEGKTLKISGAASGGNNGYYLIVDVVDSMTVTVTTILSTTIPDANNGSLDWQVLRLYSALPPNIPLYDEINTDLLTDVVEWETDGNKEFVVDQYCWESNHRAEGSGFVFSVSSVGTTHTVTFLGTDTFPTLPEIVQDVGNWKLISFAVEPLIAGASISGTAPEMVVTTTLPAFTSDDTYVTITGATTPDNNGVFPILEVLSSTQAKYYNGRGVAEAFAGSAGPQTPTTFYLETTPVRTGNATFDFGGTGEDLSDPDINGFTTLTHTGVTFTTAHVNRFLKLSGIDADNNGLFEIVEFVDANNIKFNNPNAYLGNARSFATLWQIGKPYYQFTVQGTQPPVVNFAILQYECPELPTCNYCGSNRLLITLTPRDELWAEGTSAVSSIIERTLRRLEEVRPAHVGFIVKPQVALSSDLVGIGTTSAVVTP